MIAIVDYGAGNVASVARALRHLRAEVVITSDPEQLRAARRVVFPGQGHFGQAMARLRETGLDRALRDQVAAGTPFLGICLGLQLLLDGSEEAPGVAGLGLLPGHCRRFDVGQVVPHVGWNSVQVVTKGSPHDNPAAQGYFYYVHSYFAPADSPFTVATTAYGDTFAATIQRDNLFAVQFHPEKSGHAGLALLAAWLKQGAVC